MNEKEFVFYLHRTPGTKGYTRGQICLDECGPLCDALEDEDRGLTKDMPLKEIKARKVYGQTAVPKGKYEVQMNIISPRLGTKSYAKKYGGCLPRLMQVPGWEGVLIHPFNSATESLGCIGPGEWDEKTHRVKKSTQAFYDLMDYYLVPAYKRGEKIYIIID